MTDKTIPFSVLDLAPIPEGSSAKEAFSHSLDLARLAEKRGYQRNLKAAVCIDKKRGLKLSPSFLAHFGQ